MLLHINGKFTTKFEIVFAFYSILPFSHNLQQAEDYVTVEVYLKQDKKPQMLIICTINGKKSKKSKHNVYTSTLLRINTVV